MKRWLKYGLIGLILAVILLFCALIFSNTIFLNILIILPVILFRWLVSGIIMRSAYPELLDSSSIYYGAGCDVHNYISRLFLHFPGNYPPCAETVLADYIFVVLGFIIFFIIGAFIGLIVSKIKKDKQ